MSIKETYSAFVAVETLLPSIIFLSHLENFQNPKPRFKDLGFVFSLGITSRGVNEFQDEECVWPVLRHLFDEVSGCDLFASRVQEKTHQLELKVRRTIEEWQQQV